MFYLWEMGNNNSSVGWLKEEIYESPFEMSCKYPHHRFSIQLYIITISEKAWEGSLFYIQQKTIYYEYKSLAKNNNTRDQLALE